MTQLEKDKEMLTLLIETCEKAYGESGNACAADLIQWIMEIIKQK